MGTYYLCLTEVASAHSDHPLFQSTLVGGKIQEDLDLKDNSTAKDDLLAQASPTCLFLGFYFACVPTSGTGKDIAHICRTNKHTCRNPF